MNKRKKLYEIESNRHYKSVEAFWKYAVTFCAKHGVDLTDWMESLHQFVHPAQPCDCRYNHADWEHPLKEICRMESCDWQLYLENSYNFIMEYQYSDESEGFGYLYIVEYDTNGK